MEVKKSKYDYKPLLIVWKGKEEENVALIDGCCLDSCVGLARKGIPSKGRTFEIWTRLRYPKSKGKLIYSDNKFCD